MFTQPCFIRKNTPELREYLESLGIKKIGKNLTDREHSTIVSERGVYYETYWVCTKHILNLINCDTNEELFKSIAAISNDSDYMQWFTYNNQWHLCERDSWVEMFSVLSMGKRFSNEIERDNWITYLTFFHKATVEELIKHFK